MFYILTSYKNATPFVRLGGDNLSVFAPPRPSLPPTGQRGMLFECIPTQTLQDFYIENNKSHSWYLTVSTTPNDWFLVFLSKNLLRFVWGSKIFYCLFFKNIYIFFWKKFQTNFLQKNHKKIVASKFLWL